MATYFHSIKRFFTIERIHHGIQGFLTEYETPKIVTIHSITFAIMLRVMQILLLLYGVIYLLIFKHGYQKQDSSIISSITLKVKGIGYIKTALNQTSVIDGADYIIPPSENNAIFVMTNFIRTDQKRALCEESHDVQESICINDETCKKFSKNLLPNANGRWTGKCLIKEQNLNDTITNQTGRCEIEGWCPVEDDRIPPQLVNEALNFTLFVKNFVEFPTFKIIRKNIVDNMKPCIYERTKDDKCPIFRLRDIIETVEPNLEEREQMLRLGGVIRIKLEWDCNFDYDAKRCIPKYSFGRLDARFTEKSFSVGFNFRFASHWKRSQRQYRTLTKAFGLRLIISVSGQAGKFDFITLTLNIGSLMGIFGLATFICDIVMLHFCKKASVYRQYVFQKVHLNTLKNSSTMETNCSHLSRNNYNNKSITLVDDDIISIQRSRAGTITELSNSRPLIVDNTRQQQKKSISMDTIIP